MSVVGSPIPIPANSEIDEDEVMTDDISPSPSPSTASSRASSPQTPASSSYRSRPSLTIAYPMQPSNASSSRLNISFPAQSKSPEHPKGFVAPAHPQSHHLHVLPPRKKTTRALIIDHTIWRLVRTRFAQARCELGMYVKLTSHAWHEETDSERNEIGFHALHLGQQHQHGNFGDPPEIDVASSDEEDESEEENVTPESLYGQSFKANRNAGKGKKMDVDEGDDDEDDNEDVRANQRRRAASHNKRHAPFLSARADGMQKVLFAVLLQPLTSPPVSFPRADDPTLYPMSISPTSPESLRTMPNRLRLALMLLRIVDDLFGSPKLLSSSSSSASSANAADSSTSPPATSLPSSFTPRAPVVDTLPADLETLFQISNQSLSLAVPKPVSSFRTLPLPSASGSDVPSKGGFTEDAKPFVFSWNNSSESLSKQARAAVDEPKPQAESSNPTGLRVGSPLASSPSSQSKVPVPHVGARGLLNWRLWSILDDSDKAAAAQSQTSVSRSPKQASGRARELYSLGCSSGPLASSIGRLSSSVTLLSFGSSTSTKSTSPQPAPTSSSYPIEKLKTLCPRHLREKCTICVRNSDARTRIGAGLLSTSGSWFLDRRRRSSKQTGSVLADLISDFMRLSAYIISELQEYVIGDAVESESFGSKSRSSPSPSEGEGAEGGDEPDLFSEGDDHHHHHHHPHHHAHVDSGHTSEDGMSHKPTRAWYSLLCGLITRAVLEGYVSRGWKGSRYVEVLMGMGLGVEDNGTTTPPQNSNRAPEDSEHHRKVIDEEDDEYLPEGTPSLIEACHILFDGFGKHSKTSPKEIRPPEREYISAMEARIAEFLEIPHTCPDLATHLTGLSAKYPAEPVERAALQFCEAVSKWRGKPELEMYKLKRKSVVSPPPDLAIRKYFEIPVQRESSSASSSTDRGIKRQVSPHREATPPALKKGKLKDDHMESDL